MEMHKIMKTKPRMRFSIEANDRLTQIYNSGIDKPNRALREELGRELDKSPRSIQIWFQNKRAKGKRVLSPLWSTSPGREWDESSYSSQPCSSAPQTPFLFTPSDMAIAFPNLEHLDVSHYSSSDSRESAKTIIATRSASPDSYLHSEKECSGTFSFSRSSNDSGYHPDTIQLRSSFDTCVDDEISSVSDHQYSNPPSLGYMGDSGYLPAIYQPSSVTHAGHNSESYVPSGNQELVSQRRPTLTAADIHSFFTSGIEETSQLGVERCNSIPSGINSTSDYGPWLAY